jgi:Pectate lyase superfamily protein
MVKNMKETITNYELQKNQDCRGWKLKWQLSLALATVFVLSFVISNSSLFFAQQPQAPVGTPLYSANAKYVNGMAPGYWPTAGSGLTLSLSAGTAYCGNPPAPVSYPGGSLALAASTTNYIFLDPANNCSPAVGTPGFAAGQIPIAKVLTGATSISSITDARTWFQPQPCATGSAGDLHCSSLGTSQNITLTPSGTGASVIANLQDKGGQVFNIKAYGAKGDGTTDDSAAVQAAYAAAVAAGGGTVYFPQTSSCYLISTAINATGDGHRIIFEGAGGPGYSTSGTANALICGNTGGAVFDITMGYNRSFLNLDVTAQKAGLSNPSLIGILAGRNASGQSGQDTHIVNCSFMMPLHYSGTTYSFGFYFFGEEIAFASGTSISADYPIVVTSSNNFSISSTYVTFGSGTYSETGDSFTSMELYTSGLGPAIYLYGAYDMKFSGHSYNGSQGASYPANLYNYAIFEHDCHSITISPWRQEGYPGFMYVDGGFYGSQVIGTHGPAPTPTLHAVEFNDANSNVTSVTFDIYDEMNSSTNWYYDGLAGSPTGLWSLDSVHFYCGKQSNCVDIPIGNGAGTGTHYWHNITWSKMDSNSNPVIRLDSGAFTLPLTGGFTIPTSAVPANSCSTLTLVNAAGSPSNAFVEIRPQSWYGLLVTAAWGTGGFNPMLCNPTSSPITPGSAIGATFRVVQ